MAQNGAELPAETYVDFNALTKQINDLAPEARNLLHTLNDRATGIEGDHSSGERFAERPESRIT